MPELHCKALSKDCCPSKHCAISLLSEMHITLQNDIIKQAFIDSRCVSAIASEEEDAVQYIELSRQVSSSSAAFGVSSAEM